MGEMHDGKPVPRRCIVIRIFSVRFDEHFLETFFHGLKNQLVVEHPQKALKVNALHALKVDRFFIWHAFRDRLGRGWKRQHITENNALSDEEVAMDAKEMILNLRKNFKTVGWALVIA